MQMGWSENWLNFMRGYLREYANNYLAAVKVKPSKRDQLKRLDDIIAMAQELEAWASEDHTSIFLMMRGMDRPSIKDARNGTVEHLRLVADYAEDLKNTVRNKPYYGASVPERYFAMRIGLLAMLHQYPVNKSQTGIMMKTLVFMYKRTGLSDFRKDSNIKSDIDFVTKVITGSDFQFYENLDYTAWKAMGFRDALAPFEDNQE